MGAFTTIAERIVRQPALTMPGNATGSEAACTALTGSQIRSLCSVYSTSEVDALFSTKAPLASPVFTGTPAAPTASPGTNTTQIATTAFVTAAVSGGSYLASSGGTLTGDLLFSADNTHAIGAAGATRPSAIHVGTGGVTSAGPVDATKNVIAGADALSYTGGTLKLGSASWGAVSIAVIGLTAATFTSSVTTLNNCLNIGATGVAVQVAGVDAVSWTTNELRIGGVAGSSYWSTVKLYAGGSAWLTGTSSTAVFNGLVSVGTYTVATLPAAGSNAYKMANVSDSNVAASGNYGAIVAGGGANKVRVFSDGTNWVIA